MQRLSPQRGTNKQTDRQTDRQTDASFIFIDFLQGQKNLGYRFK